MTEIVAQPDAPRGKLERGVSLFELALGVAVVIAHNVFHSVPNEVPILAGFGLLSFLLRDGGFKVIGWVWPKSWGITLLWAAAAAVAVILCGQFVSDPLAQLIWHRTPDTSRFNSLKGNLGEAAGALLLVWTFAAVGEEFGYRGYLLTRAADLGGRSPVAYGMGLVLVSIVFGFGHYYQGPAGVFSTALDGFIIGAAYLLSGRNFWVAILTHGLVDTFGVAVLFFGLAD